MIGVQQLTPLQREKLKALILEQSSTLPPQQLDMRRMALQAMANETLQQEAREFCGGRAWTNFGRWLEDINAFDALGTGPGEGLN
jgi:hypothetical protein